MTDRGVTFFVVATSSEELPSPVMIRSIFLSCACDDHDARDHHMETHTPSHCECRE